MLRGRRYPRRADNSRSEDLFNAAHNSRTENNRFQKPIFDLDTVLFMFFASLSRASAAM